MPFATLRASQGGLGNDKGNGYISVEQHFFLPGNSITCLRAGVVCRFVGFALESAGEYVA